MPIRASERARYPADWKAIADRVKARAGNRCEGLQDAPCGAEHGRWHPLTGSFVVLTTGHLNHIPEDCRDENLKAWCQRCHLRYDAEHHKKNAAETRARNRPLTS